jgi:hypothetical protein
MRKHVIVIDHPDGVAVARAIGIAMSTCQGRHAGMVTLDARRVLDPYAIERAAAGEPNALVIFGAPHDNAALRQRLLTLAIQPTWTINLRSTPVKRIGSPQLVVTTSGEPPQACCMPSVWQILDLRDRSNWGG